MFIALTLSYGIFEIPGIIIATVGAILNKSPRRKILLWGAGIVAAASVALFIFGMTYMTGKSKITVMEFTHAVPKYIVIPFLLGLVIIIIGGIAILTDKKRPASPPSPSS